MSESVSNAPDKAAEEKAAKVNASAAAVVEAAVARAFRAAPGTSGRGVSSGAGSAAAAGRVVSLDVFRGMTIAGMILVNSAAGKPYGPLEHAEWNGWTHTDLIFPFFL